MLTVERFHHDFFGKLNADTKANVAHLADYIGLLGQKPNFLLFAKAHFAEAMFKFGWGGELFDTNRGAGAYLTQRADERLRGSRIGSNANGTVIHRGQN